MFEKSSRDNTTRVIVLTIMCTMIMIVDSILIHIYTSIPRDPDPMTNSFIFTVFVTFFIFSNYIFLSYYRKSSISGSKLRLGTHELVNKSIVVSQIAISSMLLLLIAQNLVFESYELVLVASIIYVTHFVAIGFLVLLAYRFLNWFMVHKNYFILAYAFAFCIIILYLFTSLAFKSIDLSYRDPTIALKSVKTTMSDYSTYGTRSSSLATFYTYLSIISFISIWIPSILLLRTYSARLGRTKYWTLVSIPLIYFFFPHFANELGIFDNLLLQYGMQFNLIYYIIFSPYQQIGGLLFGVVFWAVAWKIKRKNLKIPIMTAGIGMILLFGSSVLHALTFIVSPPFGLVTISFLSLGAYMLLTGIFSAAKELSRDISVRREIYKIAGEHSELLGNIGIAELNKILEKRVTGILNKMKVDIDYPLQAELEESDYKEFIEDALREMKLDKK